MTMIIGKLGLRFDRTNLWNLAFSDLEPTRLVEKLSEPFRRDCKKVFITAEGDKVFIKNCIDR